MVDETHDFALTSWVEGADQNADFPIQNLPFGVFSADSLTPRIGVAIGNWVLDLNALAQRGLVPKATCFALQRSRLNDLFALSCDIRCSLRRHLSTLLSQPENVETLTPHLYAVEHCTMHVPARIGDYTDFYTGIHHAMNIGKQFRPDEPLLPNYKHIPIGYHGRASSITISHTPVVRPLGQTKAADDEVPSFGPSRMMDYELEIGVWIGSGNALGTPISIEEAGRHIAGYCLLNDWSARDIQGWEYQPLGPFMAKNFQTSISPWVITAEALAPFRLAQNARTQNDPVPLAYLMDQMDQERGALNITLEVLIQTENMVRAQMAPHKLSEGLASNMYWTPAQMVAHHTSNGCNLNPGDLLGTGTISGDQTGTFGCLLEISKGATQPITLPSGEVRAFLEDGDTVTLLARAHAKGFRSIGFGCCVGKILPAPK